MNYYTHKYPQLPTNCESFGINELIDSETADKIRAILTIGTPTNTRRAYESDIKYFKAWCSVIGIPSENMFPVRPEIIIKFVADHCLGLHPSVETQLVKMGVKAGYGTHSISTIDRRVSAVAALHKTRGFDSPLKDPQVSLFLSKARKAIAQSGGGFVVKKRAVIKDILDQFLECCDADTLIGKRDKALILFGWASGGRRRSEICNATFERLHEINGGFTYQLGVTKTNQDGNGHAVPIVGAAAEALRAWIDTLEIKSGPIFRSIDRHGNIKSAQLSGYSIALIIKKYAALSGFNPDEFAAHSLRSGFITESGIQGKNINDAMALSGHKTLQVAAGYHQSGYAHQNSTALMAG